MAGDFEGRARAAAFAYVRNLMDRSGGLVTRSDLEAFAFEGYRIPLIGQSGIRTPRMFEAAVSILTSCPKGPDGAPYDDHEGPDGYLRYKWRSDEGEIPDNRKLRRAMEARLPVTWFYCITPGVLRPIQPVYLVDEEPHLQQFVVALDETSRDAWTPDIGEFTPNDPRRRYALVINRQRLHQRVFRDRVLLAYDSTCALCRLRHAELLDAAHIREDRLGGLPVVPNGVAMCAIHHRAFDRNFLGIRPDHRIEISSALLAEEDGPTLRHALQGLHGASIALPRRRRQHPDPLLLEERYESFRAAG